MNDTLDPAFLLMDSASRLRLGDRSHAAYG
jgi:hypothetical protein